MGYDLTHRVPRFNRYIDKQENDHMLGRAIFTQEWQRGRETL